MSLQRVLLFFPLLLTTIVALPTLLRRDIAITAEQLLAIAPSASSCDPSAQYAKECATAQQAAGPISASFNKYNIKTVNEQAALLSLIVFESGSFKYDIHHFPGPNPGQGTRNMQNSQFNIAYAKSVLGSGIDTSNPDAVLAQLTADPVLDFGSAAWFLRNQCTPAIQDGLANGGQGDWETYITTCVGTSIGDRQASYQAALKALASSGSSAPTTATTKASVSASSPTTAPNPVAPTSVAPSPQSPSSASVQQPTTTPTPAPPAPAAPTSANTVPAPSPATSTAAQSQPTTSPGDSGSSTGLQTGKCQPEGQWNCIDGTHWQRCASGAWSAVMPVAAGTTCTIGISAKLQVSMGK